MIRRKIWRAGYDEIRWTTGRASPASKSLEDDVRKIRAHPLIPSSVVVGGFLYDVDTGLIEQLL